MENSKVAYLARDLFLLFDYLVWLLFDPSKFKKVRLDEIKKVVVIHLGARGELLVVTPILSALKRKLNCEINFMVSESMGDVFKNNPYVSEILIYKKNFKENIDDFRERNFDMAVIVQGFFKLSLLCLLAGIKYRIGCSGGLKRFPSFFFTRRYYPIKKNHAIEKNLDIVRQIGVDNPRPKIEVYFSDKEKSKTLKTLKKLKVKNFAIIHTGFSFLTKSEIPSRLWPLKRYAKIADYLVEKHNLQVLLTGTKEEEMLSTEIIKKVKNKKKVKITNGLFSFSEISFVVSQAKLLIAPSTSIVHVAASFDVPLINLICKKRDLYEWYPWMDKKKYKILFSLLSIHNPHLREEIANEGLLGIKTKDVEKAVDSLLKG